MAWVWLGGDFRAHGLARRPRAAWTAWIALLVGAPRALAPVARERRWTLWPLLPALLAIDLVAAHARTNPGLSNAGSTRSPARSCSSAGWPERVAGTRGRPPSRRRDGLRPLRRARRQPGQAPALRGGLRRHGHGPPVYFHPIRDWVEPLARSAGGALGGGGTAGGAAAGHELAARLPGARRPGLRASRSAPGGAPGGPGEGAGRDAGAGELADHLEGSRPRPAR